MRFRTGNTVYVFVPGSLSAVGQSVFGQAPTREVKSSEILVMTGPEE
jgi:hypothetical protein